MKSVSFFKAGINCFIFCSFSFIVLADEVKLSKTVTLTAYDSTSIGFAMAVSIGNALKDKYGADVRVIPAGNDVARLQPVKSGRAVAAVTGNGIFFAQEGVFEFAVKEWGPQPLRMMISSGSCGTISLGVAKDTGVKEMKDLRGKRIGNVIGAPALNQSSLALIAFADLSPKDETLVWFSSYGAMMKGLLNNEVDAALASNFGGPMKELEASPRGVMFPQTPHSDKAGWARLQRVAPFYMPHVSTCGVGATKEKPADFSYYPYPIITTYASSSFDQIYSLTKAIIQTYPAYKDSAPGAEGFAVERQSLSWVVPLHEGAIKAIREAGVWKPEHEAHQTAMVKRQRVLGEAWTSYIAGATTMGEEKFRIGWSAARAEALKKAGLEVYFE